MSARKTAQQLAVIRDTASKRRASAEQKLAEETVKRQKEAELRASLAKPRDTTRVLIERALAKMAQPDRESTRISSLIEVVVKKAPRLTDEGGYITALSNLALYESSFLRKPSEWKPVGKGRESLFRSLCEHLLMRYRMPPFLWSCFFHDGQTRGILSNVAVALAYGESLNKLVKLGTLPVPLTKAMTHSFLTETTSSMGMLEGIRRAQIKSLGGDGRLLRAWVVTEPGGRLQTPQLEMFWATVIQWFTANPMLDSNQIGPLTDYIRFKRNEDINFSMKGRAPLALMRSMQEWHDALQANRATGGGSLYDLREVYNPSGFKAGVFDLSTPATPTKPYVENKWFVDEILTARALSEEGKKMHHCVLSYSPYISRGETSIWAVCHQTAFAAEKVLTLEVRNASRSIVQVRGVCNRLPFANELNVVQAWASQNAMSVTGRW